MGATFVFWGLAALLWMLPEMQAMRDVKHELCDGLQEFSYDMTPAGYITWSNATTALLTIQEVFDELKVTSQYAVLRGIIDQGPRNDSATNPDSFWIPKLTGPGSSVVEVSKLDFEDFGDRDNPQCLDWLD